MFWACDSTHSWPGVTHSTRVPGWCSRSSHAERRAQGDVVPVAGGQARAGRRSSWRRSGRGRCASACRRAGGPGRDPGTRGSGRRRRWCTPSASRSAWRPAAPASIRLAPASRCTLATGIVAGGSPGRPVPTHSFRPPTPSLTTISVSAPAAAAAAARAPPRCHDVAALDDGDRPVGVEAGVVARRAVAGVDGPHACRSRVWKALPGCRSVSKELAPGRCPGSASAPLVRQRVVNMKSPSVSGSVGET